MSAIPATPPSSAIRIAAFAMLASAAYGTAIVVVGSAAFARRPTILSFAVAADLTLLIPGVFWLLIARYRAASVRLLVPIIALSLLGAVIVLPEQHRSFVRWAWLVVWALELGLAAYVAYTIRRAWRATAPQGADADVAETMEQLLTRVLGDRMHSRLLAVEMATVYYALFAPRKPARVATPAEGAPPSLQIFSQTQAYSGAVVWGLALAIVIEATVLHLWLSSSFPTAIWVLTALSAYSMLWLLGHHRAAALRPVMIMDDMLMLRTGLRLTARVSRTDVVSATAISWREIPSPSPGYLDAAQPLSPNVLLTLARPTVVTGAFGIRRTVTRIGLLLDDPTAFLHAVHQAPTGSPR